MHAARELKRYVRLLRPGLLEPAGVANANLARLIGKLKDSPQICAELASTLREVLLASDFTTALTETGLTLESGLLSEVFKRLEHKFLPKLIDQQDILGYLRRIFDAERDARWLEKVDRRLFAEFLELILPRHEEVIEQLSGQFFMSLEILGLRLAGLGYEPVVTHRLRKRPDFQHAFMDVTRHVHALTSQNKDSFAHVCEALDRCEHAVQWIRSRRGLEGVSMALTYRLLKIQQVIRRMRMVLSLNQAALGEWTTEPARDLFFEITLAEIRRFEFRQFLASNVELLAFQITEHTGKAGEHYITLNRAEWWAMGRSAALGGALVAVIAIVKITASRLHLAPAPEALLYGLIYAIGFIVVHICGATLATKQPAMTASTLAATLDESAHGHSQIEGVAEVIVRTVRSQMVALWGNFVVAFPVAVILCWVLLELGWPLMTPGKAQATLDSLHGLKSLSFAYAALAGVCLFASGLLAGFADNWFVFNKVGSRLKQSALLPRLVGSGNLDRAIHTIDHNLGFWVGNISLGFLLGSMGALGSILGLPLDIRHITFASAQFGAALLSLKFAVPLATVGAIALSIFVMGLINLVVSFSLTMYVVSRSRKIRFSKTPLLLKFLALRFVRRPLDFFIAERDYD